MPLTLAESRQHRELVERFIAHHQGGDPENDSSLVAPARWPQVRSLRELLECPELLEVPPALIPGIAYRGRATLLAGREKLGKTTFVAAC